MHSSPHQTPGTRLVATPAGVIPVFIPNSVTEGPGFYISHNDHDLDIYGGETTALVLGQMEKFYILNGDHRVAYAALSSQGFEACLDYFKSNLSFANSFSDKLPA